MKKENGNCDGTGSIPIIFDRKNLYCLANIMIIPLLFIQVWSVMCTGEPFLVNTAPPMASTLSPSGDENRAPLQTGGDWVD